MADYIEFYKNNNKGELIAAFKSSMVPQVDTLISIRQETYEIVGISFAADYVDDRPMARMRCIVFVKKH